MDLNSLYYFIETAKELNITQTAKRLNMTQQTLSNHIARLEEYYEAKLFYRHPKLQLTHAGKEVLSFAHQLQQEEANLKAVLVDTVRSDVGEISLSASSPRFNYYLPDVLKRFSGRYPNVTIDLIDRTSDASEKLVQKNQVDFAVTVDTDAKRLGLNVKSTHPDPVYFCVSDRLLYKYYGESIQALKEKSVNGADLADFAMIPYLIVTAQGRMGKRIDECFSEAGYTPRVYLKATYTTIMGPLCNAALAGCFTSHMNLSRWKAQIDADVNIFPLLRHGKPLSLELCVIYNKQRYLNHHCRFFLDLLDEQFSTIEEEKLTHINI
ncbi:MAG: LysR family transcriptional regulator [Fretibacterium sp.]|nr:LysR family transcriptional regulator [Fretibacterium sp.]